MSPLTKVGPSYITVFPLFTVLNFIFYFLAYFHLARNGNSFSPVTWRFSAVDEIFHVELFLFFLFFFFSLQCFAIQAQWQMEVFCFKTLIYFFASFGGGGGGRVCWCLFFPELVNEPRRVNFGSFLRMYFVFF